MRCLLMVLSVLLMVNYWCTALHAQERPRKKLVEYGWDVPYPAFVRDHLREMEQRPFDGIIFRLEEFNHAFDTRTWTEAQLQPQLEALRAIEWRAFTDNFLMLYAANQWGMDWFNDAQWETIAANLRLTAHAARAGRCVGVAFDPEPYGTNPWIYPGPYAGRPFAEVETVVRRRGTQFLRALQEEMPGLKLIILFQLSLFGGLADEPDPALRQEKLAQSYYALLPAFLNGMLDAIVPGVVIVDGNEGSYYYTNSESFLSAYHLMKQRALSFIAPENRTKYAAQVQAGMALYMDQVLATRPPEGGFLSYFLQPEERLRWFEHNVYWALSTADEYVWCYSERMDWWGRQQGAEWDGFIPAGADDAIRSAREKVAQGRPLGFDIRDMIRQGQQRMEAALAARLANRTATIRRLTPGEAPPAIDGRLDDLVWKTHAALEPFLPAAASGREKTEAATYAWATWDERALYLAFRCEEPNMAALKPVGVQKDDDIWMGDVVEAFISLGEQARPYCHFIVNPDNLQWDGQSDGEGDDRGWDATWQSRAHREEAVWTVEMAIPWEALGGAPSPGSRRRANLCRQRIPGGELSAWNTVVNGFVEPGRFGEWRFE